MSGRPEILRAAAELRNALDKVDAMTWRDATVDAFPRGACGHCAELLGRYLRDRLGINATYVSAEVGHLVGTDTQFHAWLEHDGLVIDISADQFGLPPVIVDGHSEFHCEATGFDRHGLTQDDRWWGQYAARVYGAALRIIEAERGNQNAAK